MKKKASTLEKDQAYREAFLLQLSKRLERPSEDWSTVRWWTESSLKQIIKQTCDELPQDNMPAHLTFQSLINWLIQLGLAHEIKTDQKKFYLLDIGAGTEAEVDPLELLMAEKPDGVVCYFSAVAFHSLTTQPVAHHHVAELRPPAESSAKSAAKKNPPAVSAQEDPATSASPKSFGTLLFRFRDTPFYSTRRSTRLVPGVQTRNYGPRTRLRITTLEQTLLDTLYKPFHCGGPEVVFEAWQEGVLGRFDEEQMANYLATMYYPATVRRVAVMLELIGYPPGHELKKIFEICRQEFDRDSPYAQISLLPGMNYHHLNEDWLVYTP